MIQQSESSTCVSIFIHRCLVSNSEARMGSFNHPLTLHPPTPHPSLIPALRSLHLDFSAAQAFQPHHPVSIFSIFHPPFFPRSLSPSSSDAGIKTEITADRGAEPRDESQSSEGSV